MTKRKQMNLVIFFIGIFILMASGYNSFLKPLDNAIINFIQGLENPILTSIYLNTTNIVDMKQSAIITVMIVIILFARKFKREALFLTLTINLGHNIIFIDSFNIHKIDEKNYIYSNSCSYSWNFIYSKL